jgi:hypothetical protein
MPSYSFQMIAELMERLPQTDLAPDGQHRTMTFGHRHLLSCALPQVYEGRGEAKKSLASWGERRASFIPHGQRSSELLL